MVVILFAIKLSKISVFNNNNESNALDMNNNQLFLGLEWNTGIMTLFNRNSNYTTYTITL